MITACTYHCSDAHMPVGLCISLPVYLTASGPVWRPNKVPTGTLGGPSKLGSKQGKRRRNRLLLKGAGILQHQAPKVSVFRLLTASADIWSDIWKSAVDYS